MNLIISGPSGAGKGSIIKSFLEETKDFTKNVSYTTRKKREEETEGKDYFFISENDFFCLERKNFFFETIKYGNDFYGISNASAYSREDKIFDVIVNSGLTIKKHFPNSCLVYVIPESIETLNERRGKRGDERLLYDEQLFLFASFYDFIIINKDLEHSLKQLKEIVSCYKKYSIRNNLDNYKNYFNSKGISRRRQI